MSRISALNFFLIAAVFQESTSVGDKQNSRRQSNNPFDSDFFKSSFDNDPFFSSPTITRTRSMSVDTESDPFKDLNDHFNNIFNSRPLSSRTTFGSSIGTPISSFGTSSLRIPSSYPTLPSSMGQLNTNPFAKQISLDSDSDGDDYSFKKTRKSSNDYNSYSSTKSYVAVVSSFPGTSTGTTSPYRSSSNSAFPLSGSTSPTPTDSSPNPVSSPPVQDDSSDDVSDSDSGSSHLLGDAAAVAAGATAGAALGSALKKPPKTSPPASTATENQQPSTGQTSRSADGECNYCTRPNCKATVTPADNFNPEEDAKNLRKAVSGIGTDENALIRILTKRSDRQIQQIVNRYNMFGTTLEKDIKGDTSLNFKKLLLSLITPLDLYYAEQLHHALKKKDTNTIVEILTSLSSCAVREVSVAYNNKYDKSLFDSIKDSTNLDFQKFLLELAQGRRSENQQVDKVAAGKDAQTLIDSGVGKFFGTDEDKFINIFAHRSFPQLKEILRQYDAQVKQKGKGPIEKDIGKEFSDKLDKGMSTMVKNIKNQPRFYAEQLHDALQGLLQSKDSDKAIRIMRVRSGIDLGDIENAYNSRYKNESTLENRIKRITWKEYQRALLSLLGKDSV